MTPGTKVGGYEIVALIGKSGMGEVYRATDTKALPRGCYQDSTAALSAVAGRHITKSYPLGRIVAYGDIGRKWGSQRR